MARGAEPNPAGAWRPALARRSPGEQLQFRSELEELCQIPVFGEIRSLMITAHEELVSSMVTGPVLEQAAYSKQAGTIHGLEALELLIGEIRSGAARVEAKLQAAADRGRSTHLEAVA